MMVRPLAANYMHLFHQLSDEDVILFTEKIQEIIHYVHTGDVIPNEHDRN